MVYVDESGDAGMKGRPGSSAYFLISAVVFANRSDAEACSAGIRAFRARLNLPENYEFKFNKCNASRRAAFLDAVRGHEFRYMAVALNKAKAWGPGFQFKESLYKYTTRLLFKKLCPYLREATVVLDGCGDREFRRTMRTYLRKHTENSKGDSPIKHVTDGKSHKDDLLQLADMVVGAVGRSFRMDRDDHEQYRAIIKANELGLTVWPR